MVNQLNTSLFLFINHYAGQYPFFDQFMILFANDLPLVFAMVLLWLWFIPKEDSNRRHAAVFAGYIMLLGLTINLLITEFYFHPRPFMDHIGTLLLPHVPETSFPSDHTTLMLSVALGLLLFAVTRKIGTVLLVLGTLGGLARVFCGIHYPFDILGSFGVSMVAGLLVFVLRKPILQYNRLLFSLYDSLFSKQEK